MRSLIFTPLLFLLFLSGTAAGQPLPDSLSGGTVVDNADHTQVEITAYWTLIDREAAGGLYGPTALHDGGTGADGVVRFLPAFQAPGTYHVYIHVPVLPDRRLATNVPVDVVHATGVRRLEVDMRAAEGEWLCLGSFAFVPESKLYVEIRNDAADGHVVADAVLFVPDKGKQ